MALVVNNLILGARVGLWGIGEEEKEGTEIQLGEPTIIQMFSKTILFKVAREVQGK